MDSKNRATFALLLVIALSAALGQPWWPSGADRRNAQSPQNAGIDVPRMVEVVGATPRQAEDAAWALDRFGAAGLELPSLTIVFHDDYESCGMREGVLRISGDSIVIHECESDQARSRRNLLHELAHVWDRFGPIDDGARNEFLSLRGLQAWSDRGLSWNQRGEEQAAEIIAWGLMLRPAPIPTSVGDCGSQAEADLAAAFELLTGTEPMFHRSVVELSIDSAGAQRLAGL
ncbi:MAG: hypothetical protein QNJ89_14990 [Acidimicrobiia bacterium]|nr:hypothetical protein [Acidimicrobiia bacterium]